MHERGILHGWRMPRIRDEIGVRGRSNAMHSAHLASGRLTFPAMRYTFGRLASTLRLQPSLWSGSKLKSEGGEEGRGGGGEEDAGPAR